MDIGKAFNEVFGNEAITKALASTILIILLGYILRKRGVFGENFAKVLTKVVLAVALPALAFTSFMTKMDPESLKQSLSVLVWGILIYVVFIFATKPLYLRYKGDKKEVLEVLTQFSSTTFFGIPIVAAIYGAKGALYASIFNIGYRIFLYSYAYIRMTGKKMTRDNLKEMFLNPIVIATFLGLFLWLIQNNVPQVSAMIPDATGKAVSTNVAFYRIDATAPWLFGMLTYLKDLASPLAWLAIGSTLGGVSFAKAASDKTSWYYSLNKVILIPIINIVGIMILSYLGILSFDSVALATTVIMLATPAATVAVSYAIGLDREALLASNASLLSTIVATALMPFWIIIVEVLGKMDIFN